MTAIIAATTIATTRNVSAELYVAAIFDIGQCTATTPQYSFSEERTSMGTKTLIVFSPKYPLNSVVTKLSPLKARV